MPAKSPQCATRLYLIGAIVLLLGLLSATVVYLTAHDGTDHALGYEFVDGQAYAIEPGDSKMYRRSLEQFGGKAAIFADDLNRWFTSLWQGKRLAYTIGALTVVIALFFFRAGLHCTDSQDDNAPPAV